MCSLFEFDDRSHGHPGCSRGFQWHCEQSESLADSGELAGVEVEHTLIDLCEFASSKPGS